MRSIPRALREPTNQVFVGTILVALSLSFLWPASLLYTTWECREHFERLFKHEMTFGLVHHVFFPVAAGVLAVGLRGRKYKRGPVVVLVLLGSLMAVVMSVAVPAEPQSYSSLRPCQLMDSEVSLRGDGALVQRLSGELREFEARGLRSDSPGEAGALVQEIQSEYANALSRYETARNDYLARLNESQDLSSIVRRVEGIHNVVYGLLPTVFLWFVVTILVSSFPRQPREATKVQDRRAGGGGAAQQHPNLPVEPIDPISESADPAPAQTLVDQRRRSVNLGVYRVMLVVWALLVVWIPARIYADRFELAFLEENWPRFPATFAGIIALGLLLVICYFFVKDAVSPARADLFLGALSVVLTVLSMYGGIGLFASLYSLLDGLPIVFYLIAVGVLLSVLGIIGADVIRRHVQPSA